MSGPAANVAAMTPPTRTPPSPSRTTRLGYRCSDCGWTAVKWAGRCGGCATWGSLEEVDSPAAGPRTPTAALLTAEARPIGEVDPAAAQARSTGVAELDRVLGGGLVPGAVVLVAGEPGVGKSTLLLDVAGRAAGSGHTVLYVSAEESASQIRLRADRIGAVHPRLLVTSETDLAQVLGQIDATNPDLLVVDSVQTIASALVEGSPGGVSQVREVTGALIAAAKSRGLPVLLVGHVTKDGGIAGPRLLEHLVDVVCQFEGDRHSRLRLVRAVKNRYGPTDEVGCFDLSDSGITGLADPSGLFLSGPRSPIPGTCVTVTLEGRRPMPTEIQTLVTPSALGTPRRTSSGVDGSRVAMMLAVLLARLGMDTSSHDVYVATVGGARAVEPATDLAVALALVSAHQQMALRDTTVVVGEVGLAGEVRPTAGVERRLAEAVRLGFTTAVVPRARRGAATAAPPGLEVVEVGDLAEALAAALAPRATGS